MTAQGGVAMWLGGRGWFSGDVLHYFVERGGLPDGSEGLMEPHSGHWQPLLITVYRVLFEIFGLRVYAPYLALTVLVHLVVVGLSYRLLVRFDVSRWTALAVCLVLLTFGAGSEAFLVEAPVALTAALALGLAALDRLVRDDFSARATLAANVLLLLAVMLSMGGVVASVWVGVFALSRGWAMMLRCVALPAVAFTAWYVAAGRDGGRLFIEGFQWLDVPEAAMTLLTRPFGDVAMSPAAGAALLLAVLAVVVVSARERPVLAALALGGLAAAVAHAVLSAIAQVPFGIDQVLTSRYRYVVLVLLLPAAALALQVVADRVAAAVPPPTRRVGLAAVVALVAGVLVHAAAGQQNVAGFVDDVGYETQQHLRGTIVAVGVGEKPLRDFVEGRYLSGDDLARLAVPDAADELPEMTPSHEDRITAESFYFTTVTDDEEAEIDGEDREVDLPRPAELTSGSFTEPLSAEPGCDEYLATSGSPTLKMTTYLGAGITVTSRADNVTTRLSRPDLGVTGQTVTWDVDPGEQVTIGTTAQVAVLEVSFDSGDRFTICVP